MKTYILYPKQTFFLSGRSHVSSGFSRFKGRKAIFETVSNTITFYKSAHRLELFLLGLDAREVFFF